MLERARQGIVDDNIWSIEIRMSTIPNYPALVNLLPLLKSLVDACGEVRLDDDEAAQIRLLGFAAESERWKVPPVPPELVRDNPLFEHLSIGWEVTEAHNYALAQTDKEAARELSMKLRNAIKIRGGRISRRRLQQLMWRYSAALFDQGLKQLFETKAVRLKGNELILEAVTQANLRIKQREPHPWRT